MEVEYGVAPYQPLAKAQETAQRGLYDIDYWVYAYRAAFVALERRWSSRGAYESMAFPGNLIHPGSLALGDNQ